MGRRNRKVKGKQQKTGKIANEGNPRKRFQKVFVWHMLGAVICKHTQMVSGGFLRGYRPTAYTKTAELRAAVYFNGTTKISNQKSFKLLS